jgi:hypothetical protein
MKMGVEPLCITLNSHAGAEFVRRDKLLRIELRIYVPQYNKKSLRGVTARSGLIYLFCDVQDLARERELIPQRSLNVWPLRVNGFGYLQVPEADIMSLRARESLGEFDDIAPGASCTRNTMLTSTIENSATVMFIEYLRCYKSRTEPTFFSVELTGTIARLTYNALHVPVLISALITLILLVEFLFANDSADDPSDAVFGGPPTVPTSEFILPRPRSPPLYTVKASTRISTLRLALKPHA